MKIKTVSISPEVEQVLREAKIDGNNLTLQSQLTAASYKQVMKILENIGFSWNKKMKCHVGAGDSADLLRYALNDGKVVNEKQTFQFFETPQRIADMLASMAGIKPGDRVLEPSAGQGALIRAIQRDCPQLPIIFAMEINPKMASDLSTLAEVSRLAGHSYVVVHCGDFLEHDEKYDRIVMNPPFTGGQDIEHVRHAYDLLLPGGRLAAIMSPSWQIASGSKFHAFREWYAKLKSQGFAIEPERLPPGVFKESGTDIATVIVTIQKPLSTK